MAERWQAAMARLNTTIDAVVAKGLALVANRLNGVVWDVDRVDGGTGRGLMIATALARLTGYEVREQGVAIVSPIPSRLADRLAPVRPRVTTAPGTRATHASAHAVN